MWFTKVAPVAVLSQPPPPPPVRPAMSSPAIRGIRRNLFGSPGDGEIDAMLSTQQEKNLDYLKNRYNIDLGEICNQQEQQQISALNKSEKSATEKHFGASMPYARLQGIKRTYQVRKANTAISISNVPKRIRDNLSSEMGSTEGQKEKEVQQEKKEPEQEKQADKVEEEVEEEKQRQ
ncbi:hypothetical protein ACLKA6_019133 [Drosophila palustris]